MDRFGARPSSAHTASKAKQGLYCTRDICIPVSSLNASYINAEVLTLLHCDHLRCRLKAKLLHHGLEVVLARTLWREKSSDYIKWKADKYIH